MSNMLGYLVLWRLPDVNIRYDDLHQLALDCGFEHTPSEPKKRGAWEQATNLGSKGIIVEPPANLKSQVKDKYGVEPTVRLRTEIISRTAPNLVRHIVRYVTIPAKSVSGTKKKLAETQLDAQTVCIMEFNTGTNVMKSTSYNELHDTGHWVNGNLAGIIKKLEDRVDDVVNKASGNDIRHGVRHFLLSQDAILKSSGGAYFVPDTTGAKLDDLRAAKCYLEALNDYTVKPDERPSFMIMPMFDDGSDVSYEMKLDIALDAIDSFQSELQDIANLIAPVLKGERTENVSDKLREQATIQFMQIGAKVKEYQAILGEKMQEMDVYLKATQAMIKKAQSVSEYRQPAKRGKSETGDE